MNEKLFFIYGLVNERTGYIDYVGRTRDLRRRMQEHRKSLAFTRRPQFVIFEYGDGNARKAELRWFAEMEKLGVELRNKIRHDSCGCETHSELTRRLLSEKGCGRVVSETTRHKLSESLRGVEHVFTPDGLERSEKTRFKKGVHTFSALSIKSQQHIREASQKQWDGVSEEERSARASERNRNWWANATPKQKAKRVKAISDACKKSEKRRVTSQAALKLAATPEAKAKRRATMQAKWAAMTEAERVLAIEKLTKMARLPR